MPTRYVPAHQLRPAGRQLLQPPAARRSPARSPSTPCSVTTGSCWLFDLPGVAEDQIELSLERRVLTIKAERPQFVRETDHVFLAERPWGAMSREIVLGDTLDLDRVEASYDRGVLTVTVPMAATAKSRKIEISHAPVETTAHEVEPQAAELIAD